MSVCTLLRNSWPATKMPLCVFLGNTSRIINNLRKFIIGGYYKTTVTLSCECVARGKETTFLIRSSLRKLQILESAVEWPECGKRGDIKCHKTKCWIEKGCTCLHPSINLESAYPISLNTKEIDSREVQIFNHERQQGEGSPTQVLLVVVLLVGPHLSGFISFIYLSTPVRNFILALHYFQHCLNRSTDKQTRQHHGGEWQMAEGDSESVKYKNFEVTATGSVIGCVHSVRTGLPR